MLATKKAGSEMIPRRVTTRLGCLLPIRTRSYGREGIKTRASPERSHALGTGRQKFLRLQKTAVRDNLLLQGQRAKNSELPKGPSIPDDPGTDHWPLNLGHLLPRTLEFLQRKMV